MLGSDKVHMIYDQKVRTCNTGNNFIGGIVCECGIEERKQVLKSKEQNAVTCVTCFDAESCSDMSFSVM